MDGGGFPTRTGGGGATPSDPGAGGQASPGVNGEPGTLGIGGAGAYASGAVAEGSGGGGGGAFGGGGGSAGPGGGSFGTGGGGGSSAFVAGAANTAVGTDATGVPSVTITYTPGGGGAPATKATITSFGVTNSIFAVGRSSTPLTGETSATRHKRGTVFSFRLDQQATVRIVIRFKMRGRRVGTRCVRDRRSLRSRARCRRTVRVATLTRTARAGLNRVAFTGRIRGRALKPRRYQAVCTARNAAGVSRARTLSFTVVTR